MISRTGAGILLGEVIPESDYEEAVRLAYVLHELTPSIGVLSRNRRLYCFLSVCDSVDELIDRGETNKDTAVLAVFLLGTYSKPFRKAYKTFLAEVERGTLSGVGMLGDFAYVMSCHVYSD